jgi:hypothetical protein
MDKFLDGLAATAYQALIKKRKPDTVTPDQLRAKMFFYYIVWRNSLIEEWAEAVHARRGETLAHLRDSLLDLLWDVDERYALDIETGDEENDALVVAYVVAVLRWYNRIGAGRERGFDLSDDEAANWIARHNHLPPSKGPQISLFFGRR